MILMAHSQLDTNMILIDLFISNGMDEKNRHITLYLKVRENNTIQWTDFSAHFLHFELFVGLFRVLVNVCFAN